MAKRPRRAPWTLSPGDLPSQAALEREPRLRGLEVNAFFRLLTMRRTIGTVHRVGSAGWVLLLIFLMMSLGPFLGILATGLIRFVCAIAEMHRGQPTLGGMTGNRLFELSLTGLEPSDYVMGLWGAAASRRARRFSLGILGALVILSAVGCLFSPIHVRLLLSVVLLFSFFFVGYRSHYPYDRLRFVSRQISAARRDFEPVGWLHHQMGPVGRTLLTGVLILLFFVVTSPFLFLLAAIVSRVIWGADSAFSYLFEATLSFVGWAIGYGVGKAYRDHADAHLRQSTDDVRSILELVREE